MRNLDCLIAFGAARESEVAVGNGNVFQFTVAADNRQAAVFISHIFSADKQFIVGACEVVETFDADDSAVIFESDNDRIIGKSFFCCLADFKVKIRFADSDVGRFCECCGVVVFGLGYGVICARINVDKVSVGILVVKDINLLILADGN